MVEEAVYPTTEERGTAETNWGQDTAYKDMAWGTLLPPGRPDLLKLPAVPKITITSWGTSLSFNTQRWGDISY